MKCSNAGCGLPGQGNFCQTCGSNMVPDTPAGTFIICGGKLNGQPCGAVVVSSQNFCTKCGAEVDQSLFNVQSEVCKRCNTVLGPECLFCAHCGLHKGETTLIKINDEGSVSCRGDNLLETVCSGVDGKDQDYNIFADTPEIMVKTVTNAEIGNSTLNDPNAIAGKGNPDKSTPPESVEKVVDDKETIKDDQKNTDTVTCKDTAEVLVETISNEEKVTNTENGIDTGKNKDIPEVFEGTVMNQQKDKENDSLAEEDSFSLMAGVESSSPCKAKTELDYAETAQVQLVEENKETDVENYSAQSPNAGQISQQEEAQTEGTQVIMDDSHTIVTSFDENANYCMLEGGASQSSESEHVEKIDGSVGNEEVEQSGGHEKMELSSDECEDTASVKVSSRSKRKHGVGGSKAKTAKKRERKKRNHPERY